MQKIVNRIIFPLILLFVVTGCTPMVNKYRVNIDAITHTATPISPSSYTMKALGEETDAKSLKFQRQSHYLAKLLEAQGYTQSTQEHLAQQVIYFDYGIEKIKDETVTYQEPDITFGMSFGYPYGYHRHYSPFWNDMYYSSYRTYRKNYTLFNRYIVILSKDQTGKELWRVDASSVGESNNLRKIVPLLINASRPYIGTNTDEPIKVTIAEEKSKKE